MSGPPLPKLIVTGPLLPPPLVRLTPCHHLVCESADATSLPSGELAALHRRWCSAACWPPTTGPEATDGQTRSPTQFQQEGSLLYVYL